MGKIASGVFEIRIDAGAGDLPCPHKEAYAGIKSMQSIGADNVQITEPSLGADVHKESHTTSRLGPQQHLFHPKQGSAVHKEGSAAIFHGEAEFNPLIQPNVGGGLIAGDLPVPEILESIGGIAEILDAVLLANGVGAVSTIGRPQIESLKSTVILCHVESQADKAPGQIRGVWQDVAAHFHLDGAVVEIDILEACIAVDVEVIEVVGFYYTEQSVAILNGGMEGDKVPGAQRIDHRENSFLMRCFYYKAYLTR